MSLLVRGHGHRDGGKPCKEQHDCAAGGAKDSTRQPAVGVGRDFPDVPEHIAGAASEAYKCLSIGATRGAASLARAVIEATAKDRGITNGQVYDKIEEMFAESLIRSMCDAAHEVRHLGNDAAHGDFVHPVSDQAAEEVLGLMSEVLDEVFQSPARVARQRAARLAKKTSEALVPSGCRPGSTAP